MSGLRLLILLGGGFFIYGCATLNEDECKAADWKSIGFEDGSQGKDLTSQFKQHRKACAEYGVKAKLDRYRQGHMQGIRHYCIPEQGYSLGKRNRSFPRNCPADLVDVVRHGYDLGRQIYLQQQSLRSEINELEKEQALLADEIIDLQSDRQEHVKYLKIAENGLKNPASTDLEKVVFYTQRNEMKKLIAEKDDELDALDHEMDEIDQSIERIKSRIKTLDARPMPRL